MPGNAPRSRQQCAVALLFIILCTVQLQLIARAGATRYAIVHRADADFAAVQQRITTDERVYSVRTYFQHTDTPIQIVRAHDDHMRFDMDDLFAGLDVEPVTEYRVMDDGTMDFGNPAANISMLHPMHLAPEESTPATSTHHPRPVTTQTALDDLWHLDAIDNPVDFALDGRYTYRFTGKGINVHILDTGVQLDHEAFGGRAAVLYVPDDDGDDASGGVHKRAPHPGWDCHGHGTHVAGIVAARLHGVAKHATILSTPVLRCSGNGHFGTIIDALSHISTQPDARGSIVVMSLGGPRSAAINAAVEIVTKLGVTVIVAAGNNDIDACGTSPASSPYAITVGSHGRDGGRSSFSNRGRCVDLYAPGEHIMSATSPFANAYTLKTGTSMAAPVVAGVVAMLLEQNPRLLPEEVRVMLTDHAKRRVVKGVPGDDRGLAVYAGIVGAPCILETDQECVFVKGLVHETCTISGKHDHDDGCVVVSSPRAPSTSHDPIITTRREGHLHMWLFDSVTMPEADRHRAALDLTVTELIKQPSGNGTSADAVVSNRTTYPQMLRFNVRRDADYQITLQRRHDGEDGPISSDNDLTPFALFVSMPRDCNAMPQPCYGHGECSPVTGTCTCPPPFYGPLCADRTDDPDKDLPGKWWLWQWLYGSAARERPHLIAAVIGTSLAYVLLLALISVTIVCVDWESVANRWRQWRCARRRVYIDAEAEPLLQDSDNGDIGEYPSTNSTRVPSVDMLHEVQVEDRQAPLLFGPK